LLYLHICNSYNSIGEEGAKEINDGLKEIELLKDPMFVWN
jgi:hypothetical protein